MKRGLERLAKQSGWAVFMCTVLCAIAVVSLLVARPPEPAQIPELQPTKGQAGLAQTDPLLEDLAKARITKNVPPPKPPEPPKKTVMPLRSLVRLKGVMDFGDPNSNEAIIEILRTGETKSCSAGKVINLAPNPNAKVLKVDSGVTFEYQGKEVRLDVPRDPETSSGPLTGRRYMTETANKR